MKQKFLFSLIISCAIFSFSFAQLPDTDIWLFDLKDSAGKITFLNPLNITNRPGYDNQPAFSPDGKYILFSSVQDKSLQSDIFKYDIKTKSTTQFTNTPTSEYSPTFMPDEKNVSVVMVEKDSAQRLWKFPIKGGEPGCILKNVDSIGYHCWYNRNTLALFILTNPFTLQVVQTNSGCPQIVADSIGRCMKMKGNTILYYTVKTADGKNRLNQLILPGFGTKALDLVMEGEDYSFFNDDVMYSFGSKLFLSKNLSNRDKKEVGDFSSLGITNISRIAISPDGKKIALVSNK